jgi:hypothetical protein
VNSQLSAYPWPWNLVGYSILGVGWLAVTVFLVLYTTTDPWFRTDTGRHLVSFTASVWGFFTLYFVLAAFPDWSWKGPIRLALLVTLVANCVWRLVMYLRTKYKRRKKRKEEGVW